MNRKKKTFILILCLFQVSFLLAQSTAWFYGTIDEAKDLALKDGKEILILFTCGEG